jgi:hypothetical protein
MQVILKTGQTLLQASSGTGQPGSQRIRPCTVLVDIPICFEGLTQTSQFRSRGLCKALPRD